MSSCRKIQGTPHHLRSPPPIHIVGRSIPAQPTGCRRRACQSNRCMCRRTRGTPCPSHSGPARSTWGRSSPELPNPCSPPPDPGSPQCCRPLYCHHTSCKTCGTPHRAHSGPPKSSWGRSSRHTPSPRSQSAGLYNLDPSLSRCLRTCCRTCGTARPSHFCHHTCTKVNSIPGWPSCYTQSGHQCRLCCQYMCRMTCGIRHSTRSVPPTGSPGCSNPAEPMWGSGCSRLSSLQQGRGHMTCGTAHYARSCLPTHIWGRSSRQMPMTRSHSPGPRSQLWLGAGVLSVQEEVSDG